VAPDNPSKPNYITAQAKQVMKIVNAKPCLSIGRKTRRSGLNPAQSGLLNVIRAGI